MVTSLPDVSELGIALPRWREWFLEAVRLVVDGVTDESAALFFQSDIKRDGRWIDKGALVTRAAEDAGAHVLFHKLVCRRPPGMLTMGRPGFTHLIAVSRELRCPDVLSIPDIITDAGPLPWVRAMGIRAAAHAVRFARDQARATVVVDPFCGVGTVLSPTRLASTHWASRSRRSAAYKLAFLLWTRANSRSAREKLGRVRVYSIQGIIRFVTAPSL